MAFCRSEPQCEKEEGRRKKAEIVSDVWRGLRKERRKTKDTAYHNMRITDRRIQSTHTTRMYVYPSM